MAGLTLTIPGQGDYLQSMSGAQSAYEKAVARLAAQRRQQQYLSGLTSDWSVDPTQQYGSYQQMLQNEGQALNQAQESSQQRGLFGGGLANQAESGLRYGQAAEQLGFKNQLTDWENQYNQGLAQAKQDQAAANLAAQQAAAQQAYQNQQFTPYYSGQTEPQNWNEPTPIQPPPSTTQTMWHPPIPPQKANPWAATPRQVVTTGKGPNVFNPVQKNAPVTRVRPSTRGGYYTGGGRI